MKKKELNLDEIEEVEQTPRRWHNHNHDLSRQYRQHL